MRASCACGVVASASLRLGVAPLRCVAQEVAGSSLVYHPIFFASSTVYAVNSYLFLAGNLRKLENFQFEVFTVPKAVCLSYQPSDLVVESFHLGVADMPEGSR